ncbi:nuclear transport factor 2 family protein [Clostridia bacterium OttesenSCG-928-O13]|nr:nuclear transport factor 2 family protein [Clostridia bacterium OttesenSCG-928-O13]
MMILTRPGKSTPQQMQDKAEIKELLEFERFCRDNALWDEMKKCFAPDSTVDISWYQGSGHGFVDASSKMAARAPHKIHNTQMWLNGNKAVAIMMTSIQNRSVVEGVPMDLSSDAKLVYRAVKREGLWYVFSFTSIYEQDSLVPAYPCGAVSLPEGALDGYRKSYAALCYTMGRSNTRPINDGLAGIDRPDLVEKLYRETDAWLCKP